jgi:hypothetical protein
VGVRRARELPPIAQPELRGEPAGPDLAVLGEQREEHGRSRAHPRPEGLRQASGLLVRHGRRWPRSSAARRTDASISTRRIDTLSTLMPNGTPSRRQ